MDQLVREARTKMQDAYEYLQIDLNSVRTGRANAALVADVEVTYYDQRMPIKALANISTPDAKSIAITPWDANAAAPIEKALKEDKALNLNPLSDGKVIHINVPPLTAERREQMVKQVGDKQENALISLRNARHDAMNEAKRQIKDKEIGEDDYKRLEKQLDTALDEYRAKIEAATDAKKQEVLEV